VLLAVALIGSGATLADASADAGCNGHVELCDRRLDEVVFAGTHNSMAASRYDGFFAVRHHGGIGAQLASGVRAFMLDLHYGRPSPDAPVVRTDLADARAMEQAAADLPADERAQLERVLRQAGAASDESDVYLCHGFCELGALPAERTFREMHDFLRENPNEVVILILEDHVRAEDTMRALDRGGLADRAWAWTPGDELPTLAEMIRQHRNVLVLAENEGGAAPWFVPAYELLQETPYSFPTPEDFSCDHERGDEDNPMFLLNHFVTSAQPEPGVAAAVNAHEVLLERAQKCADERGRQPNIVAVDFYGMGDLFDVVRELNGV
jgi:hypothetical protein